MTPAHDVARLDPAPAPGDGWDDAAWRAAAPLEIARFHPRSSTHRPRARARLGWDDAALHAVFRVDDRHVRCRLSGYQDPAYQDSCVELFVQPRPGRGYFNLELGCGGALLLSWIEDPRRTPDGFEKWTPLPAATGSRIIVRGSLRGPLEREIEGPVCWEIGARVPWSVFESCVGPVAPRPGDRWRANLFKCADASSHPHWASWAPIGEELDFHQPDRFGTLRFA